MVNGNLYIKGRDHADDRGNRRPDTGLYMSFRVKRPQQVGAKEMNNS